MKRYKSSVFIRAARYRLGVPSQHAPWAEITEFSCCAIDREVDNRLYRKSYELLYLSGRSFLLDLVLEAHPSANYPTDEAWYAALYEHRVFMLLFAAEFYRGQPLPAEYQSQPATSPAT